MPVDYSKAAEKLEKDGFAIIEGFLSKEEVDALKNQMHDIVEAVDPKEHQTVFSTGANQTRNDYFINSADNISFFFEEGAMDKEGNLTVDKQLSINKIGHALHCQDPVFTRITQSEKMKELLKGLGFQDPVIFQSMYIFKQPKIGGEVRPHQDGTFLNTTPCSLIGVWIPLEDATLENGCLWFQPGSHKNGITDDYFMIRNPDPNEKEKGVIFTKDPPGPTYEGMEYVSAEMKAGSLALIHGQVVHKSAPNTSEKSRHAYTFHLYDAAKSTYSEKNWLQPTEKGTFTHLFS